MELRSGYVVGTGVLRPEHRPFFEEGVKLLLQRWTGLCLAIENEWGGPSSKEKAEFLYQDVLTWFYRGKGAEPRASRSLGSNAGSLCVRAAAPAARPPPAHPALAAWSPLLPACTAFRAA
jgi:hypothetical protein